MQSKRSKLNAVSSAVENASAGTVSESSQCSSVQLEKMFEGRIQERQKTYSNLFQQRSCAARDASVMMENSLSLPSSSHSARLTRDSHREHSTRRGKHDESQISTKKGGCGELTVCEPEVAPKNQASWTSIAWWKEKCLSTESKWGFPVRIVLFTVVVSTLVGLLIYFILSTKYKRSCNALCESAAENSAPTAPTTAPAITSESFLHQTAQETPDAGRDSSPAINRGYRQQVPETVLGSARSSTLSADQQQPRQEHEKEDSQRPVLPSPVAAKFSTEQRQIDSYPSETESSGSDDDDEDMSTSVDSDISQPIKSAKRRRVHLTDPPKMKQGNTSRSNRSRS